MLTGSAVPYGFFDKDKSLNTCIVDGKTYTGELALPERIDTICTAASAEQDLTLSILTMA